MVPSSLGKQWDLIIGELKWPGYSNTEVALPIDPHYFAVIWMMKDNVITYLGLSTGTSQLSSFMKILEISSNMLSFYFLHLLLIMKCVMEMSPDDGRARVGVGRTVLKNHLLKPGGRLTMINFSFR